VSFGSMVSISPGAVGRMVLDRGLGTKPPGGVSSPCGFATLVSGRRAISGQNSTTALKRCCNEMRRLILMPTNEVKSGTGEAG
jgi:hypothetical protein